MTSEIAIAREVDGILYDWRARVLRILLVVVSVLMPLPLLAVLAGRSIVLPWPLRLVCLFNYLILLLAALRPSWKVQWRAGLLFTAIATTGAIQLATTQLAGSGRMSLLLLPLLALVLAGPRAGWGAAALSVALFALVTLLVRAGLLADWRVLEGAAAPPLYWALQGIMFLGGLLPLMILFTRFQTLQRRTMIAERMAVRQLEVEAADRRRLEEEVGRIGEAERQRLGAELHDGLCQHLTATLLHCSALERQRKAAGAPEAAEVERIRLAIEEAIGIAYDVARGLCPVDMAPDALVPALERLCREVRDRHGLRCRLLAQRDLAVRNPEHALHLYRIASEAVTNAVKHARCEQIEVELVSGDGTLTLHVSDDGQPAAPVAPPGAGLGLRIMSYRAGLIGGTMDVVAGAGGGTRVTCRVPEGEVAR